MIILTEKKELFVTSWLIGTYLTNVALGVLQDKTKLVAIVFFCSIANQITSI